VKSHDCEDLLAQPTEAGCPEFSAQDGALTPHDYTNHTISDH
jgi:hypothetical protein